MGRDHRGFMNRDRTGFKHAEHAAGVLEGPTPFFGHCLGFVSLHAGHSELEPKFSESFHQGVNVGSGGGVMEPLHTIGDTGVTALRAMEPGASGKQTVDGDCPPAVVAALGPGNASGLEPPSECRSAHVGGFHGLGQGEHRSARGGCFEDHRGVTSWVFSDRYHRKVDRASCGGSPS